MARKPRRLNHLDSREPSFKQIAQCLKSKLDMKGIESGPLDDTEDAEDARDWSGGVLTLSYEDLYAIAGCKQLRKRLYTEVELEAARIGLIVAFGWNTVLVATDVHFAPEGWSTWDTAHQARPSHSVARAPKRPQRAAS